MKKNKKGFTLIELLAVIVIMGVLMLAAIPAISNAISRSRKDTFASNAKEIISSVRTNLSSGDVFLSGSSICQFPGPGQYTTVTLDPTTIEFLLERGGNKSSFGQAYVSGNVYIVNTNNAAEGNDNFKYYINLVDAGGNGITVAAKEDEVTKAQVKTSGSQDLSFTPPNGESAYQTCTYSE